jgi:hypothetical protein
MFDRAEEEIYLRIRCTINYLFSRGGLKIGRSCSSGSRCEHSLELFPFEGFVQEIEEQFVRPALDVE